MELVPGTTRVLAGGEDHAVREQRGEDWAGFGDLTDHPDGFARLLCDGILRARYRDSASHPTPLTLGQVYELTVDLWGDGQYLPERAPDPRGGDLFQASRDSTGT